nr:hypothetical protein [Tanacetum cinerariifolium]
MEESKNNPWSSKGQKLETVRVLWSAHYHIYLYTYDLASREKISTYKVHSGLTAQKRYSVSVPSLLKKPQRTKSYTLFDENMRFLFKSREEMKEEDQEIIKSINETPAQKAAKRRKLSEEAQEAEDLRKRLEVVEDEDDDIYDGRPQHYYGRVYENEEEKARRHSKVYNWETATYGKIWSDEDVHSLISIETKFIAIFYNDAFTFEVALSCEPTVIPLNDNQIDFKISFDESEDEDYTSICLRFHHPNLRSVILMILTTSRIVEKEFPAITYNDALTSKLDFSEPSEEVPPKS